MPNPLRLHLRFRDTGTLILTAEGDTWEKEFPSLLEALQYAHLLSPENNTPLTVWDAKGREILNTVA